MTSDNEPTTRRGGPPIILLVILTLTLTGIVTFAWVYAFDVIPQIADTSNIDSPRPTAGFAPSTIGWELAYPLGIALLGLVLGFAVWWSRKQNSAERARSEAKTKAIYDRRDEPGIEPAQT